ncbi:hypothetical protein BKA65DRAFT_560673, partial [Rhexocercosporidium sp. MPI-PUGE-AT-0058]
PFTKHNGPKQRPQARGELSKNFIGDVTTRYLVRSAQMNRSDMGIVPNSHDRMMESQSGTPLHDPETDPEDVHSQSNLIPNKGVIMDDEGESFRCREQVRALKEQLRTLKEVILESSGTFTNPLERPNEVPLGILHEQGSEREDVSILTSEHDVYFVRVQNLERRVGELLSYFPSGGDDDLQDMMTGRGTVASDRDCLSCNIHREGDYLTQIPLLKMSLDPKFVEGEILAELNAARAETRTVEADRDALVDENADLRERLDTLMFGYGAVVQQLNGLQSQRNRLETQLDALEDQGVGIGKPEGTDEVARQQERQELRTSQRIDESPLTKPASCFNEDCEAQLLLARAERDSAIQQNEEARKTLATRTAERNGAHQRMHILEAAAKESRAREAQLQAEIRRKEIQEQMQANLKTSETNTCEAERKEIEFLQEELEHAVAAAAKAQHERDAARAEIKALEEENAIAHSAAETANDVVGELQQSLEAAKHAAMAEREKSEDSRRTQNRLRIERETVRIQVAKLERELSAAHQISMGLVRHGNITVGDLVHIREEKDAALSRLSILQAELEKANDAARELQMALDDCLARHANSPTDDLALQELSRVIAQRDEALAHVTELERLLRELEDDYRKNLDQWERQTQRDEKEIHASKRRLEDERKRNKELSDQLRAANARLKAAETRARLAEERLEIAESRTESLQIQIQQLEQDLEHSNEDRDELEGVRDRLRAECLRLGGMITAVRNEVIRLRGTTVAPDGTVQGEDGWPQGPPFPGPDPSDIPRPPTAKPVPIPDNHEEREYNLFPHPVKRASVAKSARTQSQSSNLTSFSNDSSLSSGNESLKSVSSRRRSDGPSSIPERTPHESPFPSPRQRPPGRGLPRTPPLQTSPTMSTQINPRSTRNPAPDYGASTRSKSRKRGADACDEEERPPKRKRSG